jgi:hypothetical protein
MADTVSVKNEPLPDAPEPILNYCLRGFHEDEKSHDLLCGKIEHRYRAWRGLLERRSEAASWTNKQHPALVYQAIDTLLSGLLDPNPSWRLRARPRMTAPGEVPNVEELKAGVKANELLLNDELLVDGYGEKQVVFLLQNLICGLTVQKNFWRNSVGPAMTSKITSEPIYAPNSGKILAFVPKVTSKTEGQEVYFDGPTSVPIDVRDFIWHQAATSLDTAMRVAHRVWYDIGQLKELEQKGIYKDIDKLIEDPGAEGPTSAVKNREQDLFQTDRTKDKVEVLECWIDHGRRVVSIANRKVVIRDTGNPFRFEHLANQYPFVVCSTTPDVFRVAGVSEVELIRETQEILWTLLNQRLDNLQLINNAIIMLRDDVDDSDSFDFYPGAVNLVSDPSQVQMWTPNIQIADLSLNAEGIARNDLQNLIGASQAAQGLADTDTATQANIVATLAQKRLAMKKQMTKYAARRTGEQWMAMNQQMITHDKYVPIVGKDGEMSMEKIEPLMLQGRYQIDVEQMDESELRQERRGEAQALLQVAVQSAPVFAASGTPLNYKAFMDNVLDAFDIQDKDAFYSAQPQQQQNQPSPQAPPGPGGVTAPQAGDPFQQSGTQAVAQMLAQRGGSANVGQEMPLNGR